MKTLVFGAKGQVGRALVSTAPAQVELIRLGRDECDLRNAAQIEAAIEMHRPQWIFNAAAYTAVDRAESEPELASAVNVLAPDAMARAAARLGARLLHISTDFVFGGDGSSQPYAPDAPTAPEGVYARTKLDGERAVIAACPDNLVVRTAWVHAPKGSNFVTTMLRLMGERETVGVVSDQISTPTGARSLAQALWGLAHCQAEGIQHFTDAGVASWYDFACAIQEEAAALGMLEGTVRIVPIATDEYPTPARRPAYSLLDKSRTWELLGGPAPHWRTTLRETLQDIKNG